MNYILSALLVILTLGGAGYAQEPSVKPEIDARTTPAYSLLIQRKVKLQAELESLLNEYSSDWPPAKQLQFEFDALKIEMKRIRETEPSSVSKLTSGYGALILRKVSLSAEIQSLILDEGPEWPTVKEKQRELELLTKEIQKLMY